MEWTRISQGICLLKSLGIQRSVALINLSDLFKGLNLVSRNNREMKLSKYATFFADSSFVVVDLDKFEI